MAKNKTLTEKQVEASRRNGKKGGRPKGTISEQARMQQEMRKMLTAAAREVFPSLIKAQIDLAQGVYVEEIVVAADHTGKKTKAKRRVYQRPPSQEAVKYVMDQAIGKPKETKEIDVNDARALTLDDMEAMANGEVIELDDDAEVEDDFEEDDE